MSERVYRVQDANGRGPYQPGFSRQWADEDFAPGMMALPTWMEEFGSDLITRLGRPGEHYGSAVRSVEKLSEWFSPTEQRRLAALGFIPVALRANRILAESKNQLVFARQRPLARGALLMPWPSVKVAA